MSAARNTSRPEPAKRNTPKEMVSARLPAPLVARVAAWGAESGLSKTDALEALLERGLAKGSEAPRPVVALAPSGKMATQSPFREGHFSPRGSTPALQYGPTERKPGSLLKKDGKK